MGTKTGKLCKPKMMDCISCKHNNIKEGSLCFCKGECTVPYAIVKDGEILAWVEN